MGNEAAKCEVCCGDGRLVIGDKSVDKSLEAPTFHTVQENPHVKHASGVHEFTPAGTSEIKRLEAFPAMTLHVQRPGSSEQVSGQISFKSAFQSISLLALSPSPCQATVIVKGWERINESLKRELLPPRSKLAVRMDILVHEGPCMNPLHYPLCRACRMHAAHSHAGANRQRGA